MLHRLKRLLAVIAFVAGAAGISVSPSTPAQTAAGSKPTSTAEGSTADLAEKVAILTKSRTAVDVPLNEPRAIDLGLVNVPGIEKSLTEGVTAKAYTRYVTVQGRNIGQIVLTGVEKNGRQETLNSSDFTAQFDLTKPQLDPAADVVINGDRPQLKAALEKLAAAPAEKKEQEQPVEVKQSAGAQQGGQSTQGNDIAAGYQTPSAIQVAPAAAESVQVSTDGCPIRIDVAQLKAIQQNKTITSKGGAVESESGCSDSSQTFPLQKSYSVCTDKVDLDNRTATAQYKLFYIDAGGATQEISDCTPDADKVFAIVEKFDACTVALDYDQKTATPRSALIYANDSNTEVQVRGCDASETKSAVPLVATTDSCSIRHDFTAGKSYQQGTYTYTLDGVTYQAGGCTDNGTVYPQSKIYTDSSGAYVCNPVVDQNAKTVALQSRIQITVNSLSQFITDCTPDTSTLAVQVTTDGCNDPANWLHDISAGVSYGQERYFFVDGGQRKYITSCQNSTTTYMQHVEITGWQNHDAQLFSYALTTVYIDTDSGRYNIKTSEVLPGETQMPYQLVKTVDQPNGASSYNGCNAYRETDKVEVYSRPDETEYDKKIGTGATVGPVDVCVKTLTDTRRVNSGMYWGVIASGCYGSENDICYKRYGQFWLQDDVQKFIVKNTETGETVSTTCNFMHAWNYYSTNSRSTGIEEVSGTIGDPPPGPWQTLSVPPCPY